MGALAEMMQPGWQRAEERRRHTYYPFSVRVVSSKRPAKFIILLDVPCAYGQGRERLGRKKHCIMDSVRGQYVLSKVHEQSWRLRSRRGRFCFAGRIRALPGTCQCSCCAHFKLRVSHVLATMLFDKIPSVRTAQTPILPSDRLTLQTLQSHAPEAFLWSFRRSSETLVYEWILGLSPLQAYFI